MNERSVTPPAAVDDRVHVRLRHYLQEALDVGFPDGGALMSKVMGEIEEIVQRRAAVERDVESPFPSQEVVHQLKTHATSLVDWMANGAGRATVFAGLDGLPLECRWIRGVAKPTEAKEYHPICESLRRLRESHATLLRVVRAVSGRFAEAGFDREFLDQVAASRFTGSVPKKLQTLGFDVPRFRTYSDGGNVSYGYLAAEVQALLAEIFDPKVSQIANVPPPPRMVAGYVHGWPAPAKQAILDMRRGWVELFRHCCDRGLVLEALTIDGWKPLRKPGNSDAPDLADVGARLRSAIRQLMDGENSGAGDARPMSRGERLACECECLTASGDRLRDMEDLIALLGTIVERLSVYDDRFNVWEFVDRREHRECDNPQDAVSNVEGIWKACVAARGLLSSPALPPDLVREVAAEVSLVIGEVELVAVDSAELAIAAAKRPVEVLRFCRELVKRVSDRSGVALRRLEKRLEMELTAEPSEVGSDSKDVAVKGVSFRDVAEILCEGDAEAAKETKYRLMGLRVPKRPEPIGKSPKHAQENLFEPGAIVAWLKKVGEPCKSSLLQDLRKIAVPPRPI